ncbi:alcohol dehydrogenase GroES-like domain-containing protein [Xylariaceae sp. FL1019]|nr:alcohol dehydrogenase GroES-like domain-containing protein [Xylariaceae sp. FL1019]
MDLPKTIKQAVFKELGGPLVIETVPLQMPSDGEILVRVEACGVCHSDIFGQYNVFGGGFPVVPGHEIIGSVAALGPGVTGWRVDERIGGAWHGGHDGNCARCKSGYPQLCEPLVVNGVTKNGGYSEYCLLRSNAAVKVSSGVDAVKQAPMLCAGSTVFGALKSAGLKAGETVAVQGLGGLGHMAVQFARRMGYRVIAISRGRDKEISTRELGAHEYIDSTEGDAGDALRKLGLAKLVLTTAMDTSAMVPLIKGIDVMGKLLILSLPESGAMQIDTNQLLTGGGISVQSWPVGNNVDGEKTLEFAQIQGLDCAVETFPLDRAQEAFDAMLSGKVRYRAVITMG